MMTRIYLLIFCYILNSALSEPATWLMQGDTLTNEEARAQFVDLDSHESYFPVTTRAEVSYWARPGKLISCVIAAAVHQRGHVSVVEGGYRARKVRIRYMTKNNEEDIFYVLVQASKNDSVSVREDVVETSRLGIAYEPIRNWTLAEIQDALRNNTDIFPGS